MVRFNCRQGAHRSQELVGKCIDWVAWLVQHVVEVFFLPIEVACVGPAANRPILERPFSVLGCVLYRDVNPMLECRAVPMSVFLRDEKTVVRFGYSLDLRQGQRLG